MNRSKKWVGIIAVILLILGAAIFLVVRSTNTNNVSGFSETFIEGIIAGEVDETYALFSDQLKTSVTKADWSTQVNTASKSYESWVISKTSDIKEPAKVYGKGAVAVSVRYEIVADDVPYIMETVMVKKTDTWKVDEILGYKK